MELEGRIRRYCTESGQGEAAGRIHVSTMHALALSILRRGDQLNEFPTDHPLVLDDWEQKNIHDSEFASSAHCLPTRAAEIRLAHDAAWQTLSEDYIARAEVTPQERQHFTAFHATRTNLYCCVLPGELIYRCVRAIGNGAIPDNRLPTIEHLIVDEFQDLNACDQAFVRLLSQRAAALFVAGDDDQSIYLFRHAKPEGIVGFTTDYPGAASHILVHCFRCPPAVLTPASALIAHNPNRVDKRLESLLGAAEPPVPGILRVWSFHSAEAEARAIANSCQALIAGGMRGREDQVCILIANRRPLLATLMRELANLGLPFEPPRGEAVTNEEDIRVAYCLLRILRDQKTQKADYPAHRAVLGLLHGVGPTTARETAGLCLTNADNFREIFYVDNLPAWLVGRPRQAVERVRTITRDLAGWSLHDTLGDRAADLARILADITNHDGPNSWTALADSLPPEITLTETIDWLEADSESDQESVLRQVRQRAGGQAAAVEAVEPARPKKIRVLTMHGAKGLDGSIVFIPSVEQGILPSDRALNAAGLVMEQRRLLYVALTRARAACIISHATEHTGAAAFALRQRARVNLPRSQFLNEMDVRSQNRDGGLSPEEAAQIVAEVNKL